MLGMVIHPTSGDVRDSDPGDREVVDARPPDDERSQVLTSWLVLVILALVVIVGLFLLAVRSSG